MPEGVPEPPKRPKMTLSSKPGRSRPALAADEGQTAIPLPDLRPEVPGPAAPEAEPRSAPRQAGPGLTTVVGPADNAAHESLVRGDDELVRAKLRPQGVPMRRKAFFKDTADKSLFMVFAVAGFVGIFAAKSFSYSGTWVAVTAVALLVMYAAMSWSLDAFRSNPDRLGDNCYYMGFLFTLASLSAALVALQQDTASGRGDLLEALIGGFGVALFSTIAGITLRVFFMQMRREIEDLEEQLRTELQRSARLLTDQLARAVIDLENFRIRTDAVLHQQIDGAASGFSEVAEKLIAYVATAGSAYGEASERLAANAERVAADIGRLADRVERIEVPSDLLTRQVEDARGRIAALASALETAVEAGGNRQAVLERSAQALDNLLAGLSDVARFDGVQRSAGAFGAAVEATGAKVAGVGDNIAAYASSIGGLAAQVERDAQAVARARELIERDLQESTGALHKLQGTLADVADGLVARIAGTASAAPGENRAGGA